MLPKKILSVLPYSIKIIRRLSVESLDGNMPLQQMRILFLIKEGKRQSEMASLLQVSGAAISKIINILVKKKLVTRTPGPDRRCICLKLTAEGNKVLTLVSRQIENKILKQTRKLTKQEKGQLEAGLTILEKIMGQLNEA